jgi:uncharacterized membrane protein
MCKNGLKTPICRMAWISLNGVQANNNGFQARRTQVDHSFLVAVRPYVQVSTLLLAGLLLVQAFGINIDQKLTRAVNQFRMARHLRETKGLPD